MKFYVPEIGDEIKLVKDWQFLLYSEYRNQSVYDVLQIPFKTIWGFQNDDPAIFEMERKASQITREIWSLERREYEIISSKRTGKVHEDIKKEHTEIRKKIRQFKEERGLLQIEIDKSNSEYEKKFANSITVPENTILKIDRIYIRKGISEFSSLTFTMSKLYIKEFCEINNAIPPSKITKGIRFWAKLSDVNKIEFE